MIRKWRDKDVEAKKTATAETYLIYEPKKIETYNNDGSITIKMEYKKSDIYKKINETAKSLKAEAAEALLEEVIENTIKEGKNNA